MNEITTTAIGNLTADPELRLLPSGVAVANFTVASTPRTYDKSAGEWVDGEPFYLRCTVWRSAAEHLADSLRKGDRVIVVGRLRQRQFETREGDTRTVVECDVTEVGASLQFRPVKFSRTDSGREPQLVSSGSDTEPPF